MVLKRRNFLPIFEVTTIHRSFWYNLPHVPVRVSVDVQRFRPRRVSSHWELKVLKGDHGCHVQFRTLALALVILSFSVLDLFSLWHTFTLVALDCLWTVSFIGTYSSRGSVSILMDLSFFRNFSLHTPLLFQLLESKIPHMGPVWKKAVWPFSFFVKPGSVPVLLSLQQVVILSLIHIWRCRRSTLCRSRWSPYH